MDAVVVGVDAGMPSTRAVRFVIDHAAHRTVRIVLVHVIPWSPFSFQTAAENEHRHAQRETEIAAATQQILEPLADLARTSGVEVATVVRHGNPAEALLEIAREHEAVHVVVGRTGDSGLRTTIFGSVTSRLVQHAEVPVTVVP